MLEVNSLKLIKIGKNIKNISILLFVFFVIFFLVIFIRFALFVHFKKDIFAISSKNAEQEFIRKCSQGDVVRKEVCTCIASVVNIPNIWDGDNLSKFLSTNDGIDLSKKCIKPYFDRADGYLKKCNKPIDKIGKDFNYCACVGITMNHKLPRTEKLSDFFASERGQRLLKKCETSEEVLESFANFIRKCEKPPESNRKYCACVLPNYDSLNLTVFAEEALDVYISEEKRNRAENCKLDF